MLQCTFTNYNGILCLEKPKRDPDASWKATATAIAYEWVKTDLDDICIEELLGDQTRFNGQNWPSESRWRNRGRKSPWQLRQYKLSTKNGIVALRSPPRQPYPRWRLPDSIDTSTEWYNSGFSKPYSLFLSLPAELRLQIYRYLLVARSLVRFPICSHVNGLRIFPYFLSNFSHFPAHEIYPEILETCRLIHREGTPILYKENKFCREFSWPRHTYRKRWRPWRLLNSYPLDIQKTEWISHIYLFREYHRWLTDDRELNVFQDFPTLERLQVDVDPYDEGCTDFAGDQDVKAVWRDALKSASRRQPALKSVKSRMRLVGLHEYDAWYERCKGRKLDFSLHKNEKQRLEKWMEDEQLFRGRQITWMLEISASQYGTCCYIEFEVYHTRKKGRAGVTCVMEREGEHVSTEIESWL